MAPTPRCDHLARELARPTSGPFAGAGNDSHKIIDWIALAQTLERELAVARASISTSGQEELHLAALERLNAPREAALRGDHSSPLETGVRPVSEPGKPESSAAAHPTPRTDAALNYTRLNDAPLSSGRLAVLESVSPDFARGLEIELAEARRAISEAQATQDERFHTRYRALLETVATMEQIVKAERVYAQQLKHALVEVEIVLSIVEPRSNKADYLRVLELVRAALAKYPTDQRQGADSPYAATIDPSEAQTSMAARNNAPPSPAIPAGDAHSTVRPGHPDEPVTVSCQACNGKGGTYLLDCTQAAVPHPVWHECRKCHGYGDVPNPWSAQ